MTPSRKTRRDRGHDHRRGGPPAPDAAMLVLMRLWAGDTLDADGGDLVLTRVDSPADRFVIPVGLLDELEFERKWVKPQVPGQPVELTFAGKAALARWMAPRRPGARAAWNNRGERLSLRARP